MSRRRASDVYVALLRGINVSGKNTLPMSDLSRMFERAGGRDVETYIQSGNVVFAADSVNARKIPDRIGELIRQRYGYTVPVVVRSRADLTKAFRSNPFVDQATDPKTLHVAFLAQKPATASVETLDPDRSPPDRFVLRGSEIYLWCPNGFGRSKLTNAYFDSKLQTTSTIRNWKTVTRLVEMVAR